MEQTPWEALKSFLREYDHKDGNYTEVTLNYARPSGSITLRNVFGDVIILEGNIGIDDLMRRGIIDRDRRLLGEFIRDEGSIYFTSENNKLSGVSERGNKSFFDLKITCRKGAFKIICTMNTVYTIISNMVTSIEYNREVHDVVPEDLQGGDSDPEGKDDPDSDPNPRCDLRRVVIQEGGMIREN